MSAVKNWAVIVVLACTPGMNMANNDSGKNKAETNAVYFKGSPIHAKHLLAAAERIATNVVTKNRQYPNINPYLSRHYTLELTLEALMNLSEVTGKKAWRTHAFSVIKKEGLTPNTPIPYQRQPFTSINYALYQATQDNKWLPVFVRESTLLKEESRRSPEGAALVYSRATVGSRALLIDFIQEYCARMARCGKLTWDERFYEECASQFKIYRSILRDPQSGLWSQGRGWFKDEPDRLSPGAWSRGHGWLLRGLTESLANLPPESQEFKDVQAIVKELVEALLPLQDKEGMWHALLHLDHKESAAESSGTAMIATAFSRLWREGLLKDDRLLASALKAFNALPEYVDPEGLVLSTSKGPGPLRTGELSYLVKPFPPGDQHGTFAVLFAAVEFIRLEKECGTKNEQP